jgi:hypothetical protein
MPSESSPARSDSSPWAGPGLRARAIAVALAIVLAALTFVVVNGVWRHAAPPPAPRASSVEVKLVPFSPPPAASR